MSDPFDELTEVSPGETITAEAWNNLIDAIQALHQEMAALEAERPGWIVVAVRAEDGEEPGRELTAGEISAVAASAAAEVERTYFGRRVRGRYVIAHLPPGLYDVRVTPTIASGFAAVIRRGIRFQPGGATVLDVVVPRAEEEGALPRVPRLFDLGLQDALDLLAARRLRLGQVLDAHGQAIAITTSTEESTGAIRYTAPPEHAERPVISSEPGEGTEVPPEGEVHLLISAG